MRLTDPTPSPEKPTASPRLGRVEVAGHELTIFEESPPLITAMVEDIKAARSRVWMESYIFANDASAAAVAAALAERARAGLDVRLMVDAWGSFGTPNSLFNRLRAAGVQVHIFHRLGESFHPLRFLQVLNQRNHRKLLVVDDTIAYFGGMNVVDQSGIHSTADAKDRHLPASAGWRDVHVRLVGPRQSEVAESCLRLWNRVHHLPVVRQPRWPVDQIAGTPIEREALFFFDSRPRFKYRRPQRILVPLIRQARREITLTFAYFVPLGRVLRELLKARRRGVRVRVIVPGQSDVKVVQWATRHFYEYLLKRGVRIYERKDCMLHSKVMVVDGRWSVIGSCNFDARSLRLNLEFFAAIHSPQLAQALVRICQQEMRDSVRITAALCRERTWWQRYRDRLAWSFRKWL
jgi:cardiolipin synthase A/B